MTLNPPKNPNSPKPHSARLVSPARTAVQGSPPAGGAWGSEWLAKPCCCKGLGDAGTVPLVVLVAVAIVAVEVVVVGTRGGGGRGGGGGDGSSSSQQ